MDGAGLKRARPRDQAGQTQTRLLLWHWGRRGGGSRYILELARALARVPDLEVYLSLSRQSELFGEFAALGLPGFYVDTYTDKWSAVAAVPRIPGIGRAFRRFIAKNRISVVDCTMSHLWNIAMVGAIHHAGARFLLTLHDAVPHPGENYLVRQWMLGREVAAADGVVTLTKHVRDQLCAVYAYPRARSWVVPHGAFQYGGAAGPKRYPRTRPLRLLFFGRVRPYKGLDLLLAAFTRLRGEYPGLELAIVGSGDLCQYQAAMRDLPGVTFDNRWIPEQEIGAVFAAADLLVAPYVEASQSGAVATAFGVGMPAVVTPVGGLVEQVRHMRTGLIAEETTAEAVAAALRRMLADAELYERCAAEALREVEGTLAWPAIAARIAAITREMAAASKRAER